MIVRLFGIKLLILLFSLKAFCQELAPPLHFVDVIERDSMRMYFNSEMHFTSKDCADFTRYVRLDEHGDFNGRYQDFSRQNVLLGKGTYVNGLKHGVFETYHPNGKLKARGSYYKNFATGIFEYFTDKGLPERTIHITKTDTLLVRLVDAKGNVLVADGNGDFNGTVAGFSQDDADNPMARGKIVNGKPHGKWSADFFQKSDCQEEYSNGKLLQGKLRSEHHVDHYSSKPLLNKFVLQNYFLSLEMLRVAPCEDSTKTDDSKKYTFNRRAFSLELYDKVEQVMKLDQRMRNMEEYTVGEHFAVVKFLVDSAGKPVHFSVESAWGMQFFNAVSQTVQHRVKFKPNQTKYFHLKLQFTDSRLYWISYRITEDPSNPF